MSLLLRRILSRVLCVLLPVAITSSLYLYLYPVFQGCAFPLPTPNEPPSKPRLSFQHTLRQHLAPQSASAADPALVRVLVLADPQLEGDSSLPKPEHELRARLRYHWESVSASVQRALPSPRHSNDHDLRTAVSDIRTATASALRALAEDDLPRALRAARKRLDLLGNDYYLAHIYRTLHWWSRPTHVTVLGDLIGSQWVTDEEFDRRGGRYWDRVFRGGRRVPDEWTVTGAEDDTRSHHGEPSSAPLEELQRTDSPWARRIVNIVGNHDVGYAGDASEARLERFERVFGRANYDVRFRAPPVHLNNGNDTASTTITPTLHLINLNTLTLDTPALSPTVQSHTYAFLNDVISKRSYPVEDRSTFTLLLTHLPLHKRDGVCTDGPYFSFFDQDDDNGPDGVPRFHQGGLKEQNHLSENLSATGVLQGIFGMSGEVDAPAAGQGRNGLILTGHDHTGCDVVHFVDRTPSSSTPEEADTPKEEEQQQEEEEKPQWTWSANRFNQHQHQPAEGTPSIREVTLRSMMGEYGGNAALLSLWFDADPAVLEWRYEITMCAAGVQHLWWAVHVVDFVTGLVVCVYGLLWLLSSAPAGAKATAGTRLTVEPKVGVSGGNVGGCSSGEEKEKEKQRQIVEKEGNT